MATNPVRTPADKRQRWYLLTTQPADPAVATITAGTDITCDIAASSSRISATGSDTITDPALCEDSNSGAYGRSNYEGAVAPFWLLDTDGTYAAEDNPAFEAFKVKNTVAYVVIVDGIATGDTLADGYMSSCYEVRSDTPQRPSETSNVYIKRVIPLQVKPIWENQLTTAS